MLRGSVLLLALIVNAPSLWAALYTQTTSVDAAMVHFLLTVPIVAVLLGLVRLAARSGAPPTAERDARPEQRITDR